MTELKPYPKYKDSGVEWIGEIPEEWKTVKLKYLCKINTGSKDTQDKVDSGSYPFFVRSDKIERINEYTHDEEVVMTAGDGVGVGKVFHYYQGKFSAHQRVYLFTKFKNILGKFLYYYVSSNLIFEVQQGTAKSTVDSLRRNMLTDFIICLPDIGSQIKILQFIDKKTSEIDSLIADKKRLIALLEEKRQAVITETVTKGLNPNVKMKNSGIEWIGEIPEHWDITKIKYTTYVKGRIGWQGLKSDEFTDKGPHLVTGTDFIDGEVNWDSCHRISLERYNEAPEIQLKEKDLLITKDGTIGKVAVVRNKPKKAILNSGVFVTRQLKNAYLTVFMYWLLNSSIFINFIDVMSSGTTVRHLYQDTFINFIYPLPNKQEQLEIVRHINTKVENIDNLISTIKIQITKLQEYREALIYEAVTGKIDLRDYSLENEQTDLNDIEKVAELNETYQ